MVNWNQDTETTLIKNGFIQVYDGATPYRFKKMFEMTENIQPDHSKSYNDTLEKRMAVIGDSTTVEIRTKKTSDLYDIADPPTDQKTISWIDYKLHILREAVILDFESVTQSEGSGNQFVRSRGTYFVTNSREERRASDGEIDIVLTAELKTKTTFGHRTAS